MKSKCLGKLFGLFDLPVIVNGALRPSAKNRQHCCESIFNSFMSRQFRG